MNNNIVTLEEDPETGDLILPLPPELFENGNWEIGDTLNFEVENDAIILTNVSFLERQSNK